MAPLPRKAPRRRKSTAILSDNGGVDVSSGPEQHGVSQGEHAKSSSSSNDIVSSTKLTTSTTREVSSLTSDDVHTSSTPLTSNHIPSSTLSRMSPTIDKPLPTTTAHTGGSLRPAKSQLDSSEVVSPEETNKRSATRSLGRPAPTNSLFPQDDNTGTHSSILNAPSSQPSLVEPLRHSSNSNTTTTTSSSLGPILTQSSTSPLTLTSTRRLEQTSTSTPLLAAGGGKSSQDKPVRTAIPLSDGPLDVSTSDSKAPYITSATTSLLPTTSVTRSPVLKATHSVVTTSHAASPSDEPVRTKTSSSDDLLNVPGSGSSTSRITSASATTSVLSTTSVTSSPVFKPTDGVVIPSHAASTSDEPVTTKASSSNDLLNVPGSGSKTLRVSSASVTTSVLSVTFVTSSPVFKPTNSVASSNYAASTNDEPVTTKTSSDDLLDVPGSGSKTLRVSSASVTSSPVFKPTDSVATPNHAASSSDKSVRTNSPLSHGPLDVSTSSSKATSVTASGSKTTSATALGSKTTSVTTSALSTTSVTSSPVFKPTGHVVSPNHAASPSNEPGSSNTPSSSGLLDVSTSTSKTPDNTVKLQLVPSQPSSVPLLHSSPTSSSVEGGRIVKAPASSSSLSTTSFVAPATIPVPIPSLTSVDGARPNSNQVALVDAPDTTNLSTSTAFSHGITSSFTTTMAIVSFSATQISGRPTSIPVTQTIQTVLPTVLPAPATSKKSVPVTAIVPSVSAAVILIVLLIGFMFNRRRQRARASHAAFDFSSPDPDPELAPAPAMRQSEPVIQQPLFKEVTVLPPIPSTARNWGGLAARVFAPAEPGPAQDADPFADADSTLEDEKHPPIPTTRLVAADDAEPLRHVGTVPSIVLPPSPTPTPTPRTPTLDPFIDPPPALVSTVRDGGGPSRLSTGSTYDEPSVVRASMTSSHVGRAM